MTTVIPDGYYRISLNYSPRDGSGVRVSTYGVNYAPDIFAPDYGDPTGMFDLGNVIAGIWDDNLADVFLDSTSLDSVAVSTADFTITAEQTASQGTITDTTEELAPLAAVIQKRSALGGRKFRGRIFHPDVLSSDNVNSRWTSGAMSRWADAYTAFWADHDGHVAGPPVWDSLNGHHLLHSDATTPTRVVSIQVNPRPGFLRGRLYD